MLYDVADDNLTKPFPWMVQRLKQCMMEITWIVLV